MLQMDMFKGISFITTELEQEKTMISLRETEIRTVVVGTGAAGYHAAVRLHRYGEKDLAILAEHVTAGTSRNTGSDKQTYYKLSLAGEERDCVRGLAEDLFRGQCVDGDLALCEAALSTRCFYHLVELGVPFPDNEYGEYVGYKTDHDRGRRATSVGPYTSKFMTECLEREALSRGIPVLDHMQMVKLLVRENQVRGVLCLDTENTTCCDFLLIWCENVVLATGGPAGMYRDSVYPASQLGSSGIAFEAGVLGKNLTEWQFGIASLRPRWNVSGTYMQALPRLISTDRQGGEEREFLLEYYEDMVQMQYMTFLKGYQWPFDVEKIFGGSSVIDLLVYQETVLRGRRVFLDFMHNPGEETVDFDRLPAQARDYLRSAGACFGTPIERLECMNEPAVQFYREHGVDLGKEMLEIAVCVQHNNGGLSTDANWQTNIRGIFAVGEVCGSHGVTRPGGSALNAGQVGALRAAEYIARTGNASGKEAAGQEATAIQEERTRELGREAAKAHIRMLLPGDTEWEWEEKQRVEELWEKAAKRMSRAGGMVRNEEDLRQALSEVKADLRHFGRDLFISSPAQAARFYHLYDMLISQQVYLTAMLDYVLQGGGSRGSALYTCPDGEKPGEGLPDLFRCRPDKGALGGMIQEIGLWRQKGAVNSFTCQTNWRKVRPIPNPDTFFETQWKAYRERWNYL